MNEAIKCPKCNGEMAQGFVPDFHLPTQNVPTQKRVGGWFEGQPKKSFWTGTQVEGAEGIPIGAFRCARCGFLEFFANPEFAAT